MYLKLTFIIASLFTVSCHMGGKIKDIHNGMTHTQVEKKLGKPDHLIVLDDKNVIFMYKSRLVQLNSWDTANYYVDLQVKKAPQLGPNKNSFVVTDVNRGHLKRGYGRSRVAFDAFSYKKPEYTYKRSTFDQPYKISPTPTGYKPTNYPSPSSAPSYSTPSYSSPSSTFSF